MKINGLFRPKRRIYLKLLSYITYHYLWYILRIDNFANLQFKSLFDIKVSSVTLLQKTLLYSKLDINVKWKYKKIWDNRIYLPCLLYQTSLFTFVTIQYLSDISSDWCKWLISNTVLASRYVLCVRYLVSKLVHVINHLPIYWNAQVFSVP